MLGFTGSLEGLTEFRKAAIPTFIVYYGKRTQIKIKKGKKLVLLTENEQPRKLRVVWGMYGCGKDCLCDSHSI